MPFKKQRKGSRNESKNPGINIRRKRKVAQLVAAGVDPRTALTRAGYSASYVHTEGQRIIQRPVFRSMFTELIEKGMEIRKQEFADVVKPYLDGLTAAVVVKSATEGIATIARDPETQELIPDHEVRIKSADRIIGLYGGVPKEMDIPPPPARGLTIIIAKDGGNIQVNQQQNTSIDRTKIEPTGEPTKAAAPKVKIQKG